MVTQEAEGSVGADPKAPQRGERARLAAKNSPGRRPHPIKDLAGGGPVPLGRRHGGVLHRGRVRGRRARGNANRRDGDRYKRSCIAIIYMCYERTPRRARREALRSDKPGLGERIAQDAPLILRQTSELPRHLLSELRVVSAVRVVRRHGHAVAR
jgi:hypothetical protein